MSGDACVSTRTGGTPWRKEFSTRFTMILSRRRLSVWRVTVEPVPSPGVPPSRRQARFTGRRSDDLDFPWPSVGALDLVQELVNVNRLKDEFRRPGIQPADLQEIIHKQAETADICCDQLGDPRLTSGVTVPSGSASSFARSNDASPTSAATGVRSSWVTSAAKRRSRACPASRSVIWA